MGHHPSARLSLEQSLSGSPTSGTEPARAVTSELSDAVWRSIVELDDAEALDEALSQLDPMARHEIDQLKSPEAPRTLTHGALKTLGHALVMAAQRGHDCVFHSDHLMSLDAVVRYLAEQRSFLIELAKSHKQRDWASQLDDLPTFGFGVPDVMGSGWRLRSLAHRIRNDRRSGMNLMIANQRYREELEAIARHIPGHRTDDPQVQSEQYRLAQLALALGYHHADRSIAMAVPAELTTTPPSHIVTCEPVGRGLHGEPIVTLYFSEAPREHPRGLNATELRQWGHRIAQNVSLAEVPQIAATFLGQRHHINRFGLATVGSAIVIIHTADDDGRPDEGRPLIRTDNHDKLFAKTVEQLLGQTLDACGEPRSTLTRRYICERLASLAGVAEAEHVDIAMELFEKNRLVLLCDTDGTSEPLTAQLHEHEISYSDFALIRFALVSQLSALNNSTSGRRAAAIMGAPHAGVMMP